MKYKFQVPAQGCNTARIAVAFDGLDWSGSKRKSARVSPPPLPLPIRPSVSPKGLQLPWCVQNHFVHTLSAIYRKYTVVLQRPCKSSTFPSNIVAVSVVTHDLHDFPLDFIGNLLSVYIKDKQL